MTQEETLKAIVKEKYSQIALQDKDYNAASLLRSYRLLWRR
ncbi:hypothetical protein [Phnomibacter ginsenosidimutans]|nr:hypothetical protein [Phnomibacter ginsenosidimutans]